MNRLYHFKIVLLFIWDSITKKINNYAKSNEDIWYNILLVIFALILIFILTLATR